jgi:DNA-binding NtrC family response regulator
MKKKFKVKGAAESQVHANSDESQILGEICPGGFIIIGASSEKDMDELGLVENIRKYNKKMPIILIAGNNSEKQMLAALKIGVNDFFKWPFSTEGIVESIKNHHDPEGDDWFIASQSAAMKKLKLYLKKIALTDSNVLITGETGTGKDVAAEFIHRNSMRKNSPLLSINCTAFPETLLESELFGYEKGSFTNALAARPGKFEMASGGTLFLDEIGDMGIGAQAKILRAIEKKEIWRIGGERPYLSDFRLITATNRDPEYLISIGKFRDDLYYRLNIARVHIPPLRDRKEDIGALSDFAVTVLNRKFNTKIRGIDGAVLSLFKKYDWPGNVRQLNNVIEAAYINSPRFKISVTDLPDSFRENVINNKILSSELTKIRTVLGENGWNISKAAKQMSMSRMTLYRKMVKYHISRG